MRSGSRRFNVIRDAKVEQILADHMGFRTEGFIVTGKRKHSHRGQWSASRSQVRLAIQSEQGESRTVNFDVQVPTMKGPREWSFRKYGNKAPTRQKKTVRLLSMSDPLSPR